MFFRRGRKSHFIILSEIGSQNKFKGEDAITVQMHLQDIMIKVDIMPLYISLAPVELLYLPIITPFNTRRQLINFPSCAGN